MNICNLEYANNIVSSIEEFLYFSNIEEFKNNKDIKILEQYVEKNVEELRNFNLSDYLASSDDFKSTIEYLFDSYDLVMSDFVSDITSSIVKSKSNISPNFSSTEVVDLFHTLPLIKADFENKINGSIIKEILIGDPKNNKYVSSNEEITQNLSILKNKAFREIQQFLKSKNLLKRNIIDLYNDKNNIVDYSAYKEVINTLDKYFFSGENFAMIDTYSGKRIPNLDMKINSSEDILNAYYNGILLSNFDSVVSTYYEGILDVNYNMFNDLRSNLNSENKYELKIKGIKTDY